MTIHTINPATGQKLSSYKTLNKSEVNCKINEAHQSFQTWRVTAFSRRRELLLNLAQCLQHKKNEFAELMALEMGKPVKAGLAEIEKCVWICEHYAAQGEKYLQPIEINTKKHKSYICYEPLGIIFAIMPWNFPFWQIFRFAVPTIMAGNVGILKHASLVSGCAQAITDLFSESGFPLGVFQHVLIKVEMTAEIIAHPHVRAVTLTGSEKVGKIVAAHAAANLKKGVFELGGSDPYIVLADAEVDLAAEKIVTSRMINNGQSCIGAKRIIVSLNLYQELITRIMYYVGKYKQGSPHDKMTDLGPLAGEDLRTRLHHQVTTSIKQGAKLILGGFLPKGPGFYYPPTILTDALPGMCAFEEELFGPVIAIVQANDDEEAIKLANQSNYGLGAAIFTKNVARGESIARHRLEAGTCCVNDYVTSDPRLPFGGVKQSGYGRELAREGILEFVNIKTVIVND